MKTLCLAFQWLDTDLDLEARIRAHRDTAQARFDSHGLPRLGTTNRALAAWIDDNEYLLPEENA